MKNYSQQKIVTYNKNLLQTNIKIVRHYVQYLNKPLFATFFMKAKKFNNNKY